MSGSSAFTPERNSERGVIIEGTTWFACIDFDRDSNKLSAVRPRAYFSSDVIKLQSSEAFDVFIFSRKSCEYPMKLRNVFSKGIYLKRQRAGQAETGPLAPVLREISRARPDKPGANYLPAEGSFQPISPVGFDLAQIIIKTTFRVLFVNTDGSGVAPWRGLIVLDADYRGAGQVESPHRIGLVAHELTHLLQRDIKGSHYWPGGGLNPKI